MLVRRTEGQPYELSENEGRKFMVSRYDKLGGSSRRILHRGMRFLFNDLLHFDWEVLKHLKVKREIREPAILTRSEVRELMSCVKERHMHAYLWTVYSCGLRLSEGCNLKVGDVDSGRMLLHVRQGKGGKDRFVVLPRFTLRILRDHWKSHRNPAWLFPATGRGGVGSASAKRPTSVAAVQCGMARALKRSGIRKTGVTIHTLRHSYATHCLEAGVRLTVLQQLLGHSNISTTFRYIHLSKPAKIDDSAVIDKIMGGGK